MSINGKDYAVGNLLDMAEAGDFDLIVHGCNCMCVMGAGIAEQIRQRFPKAYHADLETERGYPGKIGTISWSHQDTWPVVIVNAYIQFDYRRHNEPSRGDLVNYSAIRACFREVARRWPTHSVGYPLIGAGLAGGHWDTIWRIIKEELVGMRHKLVVLDRDRNAGFLRNGAAR